MRGVDRKKGLRKAKKKKRESKNSLINKEEREMKKKVEKKKRKWRQKKTGENRERECTEKHGDMATGQEHGTQIQAEVLLANASHGTGTQNNGELLL